MRSVPSVAVTIATFGRTEGLRELLDSLDRLTFSRMQPPPDVRVVIADNNPHPLAAGVVEQTDRRWPVEVVHEPRRGIPVARNAALEAAGPDVDYLAFVDDDQVVDPAWLDELLDVARRHSADIVAGPLLPQFERPPPDWVIRGGFFAPLRVPSGTVLSSGGHRSLLPGGFLRGTLLPPAQPKPATNNVLVSRSVFDRVGHFDESLRFAGGSDRDLFDRAEAAGLTAVWADDAFAFTAVPPSRVRVRWLARRQFRYGNNHTARARNRGLSMRTALTYTVHGTAQTIWGLAIMLTGALRGRHIVVRGLLSTAQGLGRLSGLAGHVYEEYAPER